MRPTPLLVLAALVAVAPCRAGSAGVSDGSIGGLVVDGDGVPVSGVFVVAQRDQGTPPVIRSTRSDAQGRFYLPLPTGGYILGFSKFGFETIDTAQGDQNQRTALGAQVRAFVEPGRTSMVPDVILAPTPVASSGTAVVRLADAITGDPLPQATVIVGSGVTTAGGADGVYRLRVLPNLGEDGKSPQALPVVVQADGFRTFQGEAVVVGGAEQQFQFAVTPLLTTLSGFIELDPTIPASEVSNIQIVVDRVPPQFSQGTVTSSGYFEVMVPASNAAMSRSFNLQFLLRGASVATLANVLAPTGGARNLGQAVRLEAVKTEVSGNVIASDGTLPQGGRITQAVIVELGRAVPVTGGSFVLSGVPVGRPLTLRVSIENPTTGRIETGETSFTAASGGGVFAVPPIITTPLGP